MQRRSQKWRRIVAEVTRFTPLEELPELLRVEEVASYWDVSRGIVYELVRRGELPSLRLGRLVRVPRSALARKIDRGAA
jgi:excisionase family DNA binding protein